MTFHDKMPVLLLEDMEDITKTGNLAIFSFQSNNSYKHWFKLLGGTVMRTENLQLAASNLVRSFIASSRRFACRSAIAWIIPASIVYSIPSPSVANEFHTVLEMSSRTPQYYCQIRTLPLLPLCCSLRWQYHRHHQLLRRLSDPSQSLPPPSLHSLPFPHQEQFDHEHCMRTI